MGFSACAMKTGEEKNEAKQDILVMAGRPRSNNYAVCGSDILLALERS